jgi:2-polyprenyl-6-hydroxyphenyl methylase / 3-demethylubiquinone-9 3-methyltransferase
LAADGETRAASGTDTTVDPGEVARFAALAERWWDPNGAFHALHRMNPTRVAYVRDRLTAHFGADPRSAKPLRGLRLLDVDCGGGLLAEPLARLGAGVTGIDVAPEQLRVARLHAEQAGLSIDYRAVTAEALAAEGRSFDAVLAMEVVEHVADAPAFMGAVCRLVRPGGALVMATLNRTLRSFALGIVAAEYMLGWLPRGTHRWSRFPRPSELATELRYNGLVPRDVTGVAYDPLAGRWRLSRDAAINYMLFATKP